MSYNLSPCEVNHSHSQVLNVKNVNFNYLRVVPDLQFCFNFSKMCVNKYTVNLDVSIHWCLLIEIIGKDSSDGKTRKKK
jgi:hypothetical protein